MENMELITKNNAMLATANYFDPSTVNNVDDAISRLDGTDDMKNLLELCRYRMIYDVATKEVDDGDGKKVPMYRMAKYQGKGKGDTMVYCTDIFEFCANCLASPIARAQVYNVLKVGELIQPNGKNTIFAYTEKVDGELVIVDFTFTQLVAIVESGKDKLFDEKRDGKKLISREFKRCDLWVRATASDGSPLLVEDENGHPAKLFNKVEGETETVLNTLVYMQYITPHISAKKISALIKDDWEITKYGVRIPETQFKQHKGESNTESGESEDTEKEVSGVKLTDTPLPTDKITIERERTDWKVLANILEKLDNAFAIDFAKDIRKALKI